MVDASLLLTRFVPRDSFNKMATDAAQFFYNKEVRHHIAVQTLICLRLLQYTLFPIKGNMGPFGNSQYIGFLNCYAILIQEWNILCLCHTLTYKLILVGNAE